MLLIIWVIIGAGIDLTDPGLRPPLFWGQGVLIGCWIYWGGPWFFIRTGLASSAGSIQEEGTGDGSQEEETNQHDPGYQSQDNRD